MKKLLPPILFVIFSLLMIAFCWALGSPHTIGYPYRLIGALLLISGLGLTIYHSNLFAKSGANIETFAEPTKFIKSGFYRYSRNPMYVGFVIALLGFALLYQGAISSFLLVFIFWLITDRWYIRHEESDMLKTFGDEYREYCKNTPRWLGIVR